MCGKSTLVVLLLSAGVTGCNLICQATRNIVVNPLLYHERLDECNLQCRAGSLAETALAEMSAAHPGGVSRDYERGFKQGFVDYIERGGTTDPPPLPPRDYWKIHYQSTEGQNKIRDWFAGFHDGATAASNSGYRQLVIVPVALPDSVAPWTEMHNPVTGADTPAETLPPPRSVDEESKGSNR